MLSLPELAEFVREHHHDDLFRLETLPAYEAASDGDDYARFLRGEQAPAVDKTAWLTTLRTATAEGRTWRRVRAVHSPLTDYERYACAWSYPDNVAAGELVRVLDHPDTRGLDEQSGDFFVVDGVHVLRSRYTGTGRLLGAEPVPTAFTGPYLAIRDLCWSRAVAFTSWAASTDGVRVA